MILEINVFDTITVVDTLAEAEELILEVIKKWFASEDQTPLAIVLTKREGRGPPALGINVHEVIRTNEAIG